MNNLEKTANEMFKLIALNYEIMINVCKVELEKGYDNWFWSNKLKENVEAKHRAEEQILKEHIPSQQN